MFENLKNGWRLGKATRELIFKDKNLLLYPILGGLILFALALMFFVPLVFLTFVHHYSGIAIVAGVILYTIISTFVSVYFLMGLLIAFRYYAKNKKKLPMANALSQASKYWVQILEWAVFYSILVTILRMVESRIGGFGGMIIGALGSMALSLATIFVVPSILDNSTGPIKSLEKSVSIITKNFGATFGGIAYSDLYSLLIIVLGGALFFVGILAAFTSPVLGFALVAAGIVIGVFGLMLNYVLSNTFIFILYEYANGKKLPSGFTKDMMDNAIRKKKASRLGGSFV